MPVGQMKGHAVRHLRQARSGFSLTEVLMAVGVLGVGMTMVASVFPVAVDQSRQSREDTMAALSARSVAAIMRAYRPSILDYCRDETNPNNCRKCTNVVIYSDQKDKGLPDILQCYNPYSFLYDRSENASRDHAKKVRKYAPKNEEGYGLWSVGSYVPVVFATPMKAPTPGGGGASNGVWRIAIAIFKARGDEPQCVKDAIANNPKRYAQTGGKVGGYLLDWDTANTTNHRGHAYKIEQIDGQEVYPAGIPLAPGQKKQVVTADRAIRVSGTNSTRNWLSLPDAVAVYHTILGD